MLTSPIKIKLVADNRVDAHLFKTVLERGLARKVKFKEILLVEPAISLSALHSGQSDWSLR